MDNRTKILIALPVLFLIIMAAASNYVPFEEGLSGPEIRILNFTPSDIEIKEKQVITTKGGMKGPFDFSPAAAAQKDIKKDDLVNGMDYNDNSLSLVVISGGRRMAIINGNLLEEGDTLGGTKIAKIEPDRVLLKNRSSRWLYLVK